MPTQQQAQMTKLQRKNITGFAKIPKDIPKISPKYPQKFRNISNYFQRFVEQSQKSIKGLSPDNTTLPLDYLEIIPKVLPGLLYAF